MNLNFVPSLQHLTLAKIAIALCIQCKIKALLKVKRGVQKKQSQTVEDGCYWEMLERPRYTSFDYPVPHTVFDDVLKQVQVTVNNMISSINVAPALKKKILNFIPHIIVELNKWEEDHSGFLPAEYDAHIYFCWKSVGIIDRESTAENLLKNGNLSVKQRFFLACLYCMQNHLSSLWDCLYDSYKAYMISRCHNRSFLNYWIIHLDGLHFRRSVFPDTSYITNIPALNYFYNECGSEDKKEAFLYDVLSKHWENVDVVCACISKLCQNHYEKLSSAQCRNILGCFLNWPLQSLFLDMSEHLLVKLDQFGMNDLLHNILRKVNTCKSGDIDYVKLLKELWGLIPAHYKTLLKNTPDFQHIETALKQTSAKSLMLQ